MTTGLVERLEQAAHAVRLARYALPASPGWEWWHQSLWEFERLLTTAAEDIHAETCATMPKRPCG